MTAANRRQVPAGSRKQALKPTLGRLEDRCLLAINLVNVGAEIAPPVYGVGEYGLAAAGGAGWSVAEVGDVNADGYDDVLIGAPTTVTNGGSFPIVGNGANSAVYLIFGSDQVNAGNFDYRLLNPTNTTFNPSLPNQRGGDLSVLGNTTQTNPVTGQTGFAFNGVRFIAGQNPTSALGASVAAVGDVNGDGIPDFMIGAPGATDASGLNANTGRAYLIYGSSALTNRLFTTIDLDDTTGSNANLAIMTFTNLGSGALNARTGTSVSGAGDFITDGFNDISIGAPGASITGLANQGAVYVVSGAFLRPARTITVPLNFVGQGGSTNVPGLILAGAVSGDNTGFSTAGAGDTTGRTTTANQVIGDLLIGAPDVTTAGVINGTGSAYLVYGGLANTLQNYVVVSGGMAVIPLSSVGTLVPGAVFTGAALGDETGYAVSTAGDFNADGLADVLIGSPGWDGVGQNAGRATLILGRPASSPLLGIFDLSTLGATGAAFVEFDGAVPGALTGFSLTATGRINNDLINEIAIGAPGVNGGSGQVYLIPGNPELFGIQSLAATESLPIQGLIISNSFPGVNLFGASVSGNPFLNSSGRTVDNDSIGDLIIGAPGLSLNSARLNAGAAYILEGTFLPLPNIVSTAIVATIGIDKPFPPFQINATQPPEMLIYVLSDATLTPPFVPTTDIDPSTVVVNGVPFPNATITADPVDENGDGLPDAIITIAPRSALGLRNGPATITFQARTLSSSLNANRLVTGQARVTVTGGGGGGGAQPSNRNALLGLANPNAAVPDFGGRLVPNPSIIGRLTWGPRLRALQAYKQFLPQGYFAGRVRRFYHGPRNPNVLPQSRFSDSGYKTTTLGRDVSNRSKYPSSGVTDARRVHKYGPYKKS